MKQETLHSQPTIEKSGEIALFYNIAYNRLCQFIGQYEGIANFDIRDIAKKINGDNKPKFKDVIYKRVLKLKTYLAIYEKIMDERKGGGVLLDNNEIILINETLLIFQKLRDYYSHFYHQDPKTELPVEFAKWLESKAKAAIQKYPDSDKIQKDFLVIKEQNFGKDLSFSLTAPKEDLRDPLYGQGVDFFLSFFLPRSFMTEYLNQRKGYKRTSNDSADDTDYTFFRKMCLHYSKRDSNRQNYLDEKGKITELTYLDYLNITKQSYLNSLPDFLFPYIKDELIPQTVIKNPNNFLQMAVAFLSLDGEMPRKDRIQWEIVNKDLQNETAKENEAKGRKIVTPKYERKYTSNFENEYDQLCIENKRVRMQVSGCASGKKVDILIHEREIISLYFQKLYEPERYQESIRKLVRVAEQYVSFLSDALKGHLRSIKGYGELKPYIEQKEIDWRKSGEHKTKLPGLNSVFQWFFEDVNNYNADEFKKKVVDKIHQVTEELEKALRAYDGESETTGKYDFLKIPTRVYDTPEAVKGLDQKPWKERTEADINAHKEWMIKKKELKGIRHKKMQLALYAKDIIAGKKIKFGSQNEKESFLAYCYLLDVEGKERPAGLIANIKEKLNGKIKDNAQAHFNRKYLCLLEQSKSFDDFVIGSIALAAERNKDILMHIDKAKEERIFNLAKKYDVAIKSVHKSKNQEIHKNYYDNRRKEILSAYIDNVNKPETFLLQLPKRFFNPYEQGKQHLSGWLKENEKETYEQVISKWREQIKEEHQVIFNNFKAILDTRDEKTIELAKKLNYEIIMEILIEKSLAKTFLETSSTGGWAFATLESGAPDYSIVTYPYRGFSITAPIKELRAFNSLFSGQRFNKILEHLSEADPGKKDYTLGEIKHAIFQHLWESRTFISKSLELDKKYAEKYHKAIIEKSRIPAKNFFLIFNQLSYFKMFDRNNKEMVNNLNADTAKWQKWIEYRNGAFHADILPVGITYSKLYSEMNEVLKTLNFTKDFVRHRD